MATNPPESSTWVVIFRAEIYALDEEYAHTSARMRELALTKFGCLAFHAVAEGNQEVSLSYWPSEDAIRAWRTDPEHLEAQRLGRERWYRRHSIEVARIERAYGASR